MKQEQFKNVYQQIRLSEKQKDMLWKRIDVTAKQDPIYKRAVLPTRIAACFAVLLLSGMTVFAANELSLMDQIASAVNLLTQNKEDLSEDQKNIYAEYGQALDTQVALDNGTLILDAALYDENHLLIPFRYIFDTDDAGYEKLAAGTEFDQEDYQQMKKIYHQDTNAFLSQFEFRVWEDTRQLGENSARYLITDPVIAEDETISGSFLLTVDEHTCFSQGNVVQLVRTADDGSAGPTAEDTGTQSTPETYAEFTLEKTLAQHELTIGPENAEALKTMGISVERMTLSPLSLCYSGKGTHTKALSASITLILKDGSIVENSATGSGYALSDANRNNTNFSFFASELFAVPVLIDDVAEIHIQDYRGTDVHIPVQ